MRAGDWIRVKDNLPDVDTNVLICTSNGKVLISSMYLTVDCTDDGIRKKRWRGNWMMVESITHWMPIVLPKKE
jgi:hypothetical protein